MTALAWTRELPTKPGTYAWRDDWNGDDAAGTLLIVTESPAGFVAAEPFGAGTHTCANCQDPVADYAGGEWLGPLPE